MVTGEEKAIIEYNGEQLVLSEQSPVQSDVTLMSIQDGEVTVMIRNEIFTLDSNYNSALIFGETDSIQADSKEPVILWQTSNGFFFADGVVNGRAMKFLVDTGADIVTFSSVQADQLGIDYQKGRPGYATTASGITALKTIKLERISIGHIALYNVDASVVMGQFPEYPLLGGSVLNSLNMTRTGSKMELSKQ